jgi:hypothetical protein
VVKREDRRLVDQPNPTAPISSDSISRIATPAGGCRTSGGVVI